MRNPFKSRVSSNAYSSLWRSISFLPPGVNVYYHLALPTKDFSLNTFAREVESALLTPLIAKTPLIDLKGGGPSEKLFSVNGTVPDEEGEERLPLQFALTTAFHDFTEPDHIRFLIHEHYDPPLSEQGDRSQILLLPDLKVERVSFACDFFKSTIITRISRFGPVAAERLTIEAHANLLEITIAADGLDTIDILPFSGSLVFETLDKIVSLSYGYAVLSDYRRHQEQLK